MHNIVIIYRPYPPPPFQSKSAHDYRDADFLTLRLDGDFIMIIIILHTTGQLRASYTGTDFPIIFKVP